MVFLYCHLAPEQLDLKLLSMPTIEVEICWAVNILIEEVRVFAGSAKVARRHVKGEEEFERDAIDGLGVCKHLLYSP